MVLQKTFLCIYETSFWQHLPTEVLTTYDPNLHESNWLNRVNRMLHNIPKGRRFLRRSTKRQMEMPKVARLHESNMMINKYLLVHIKEERNFSLAQSSCLVGTLGDTPAPYAGDPDSSTVPVRIFLFN